MALTTMHTALTFDAVVLLTRGGYGRSGTQHLSHLITAVGSQLPDILILGAAADQADPSLHNALTACQRSGATQILVVPIFVPSEASLQTWLAKVVRRWQAEEGNSHITVSFATSLADHPSLPEAITTLIHNGPYALTDVRTEPPANWEQDPAGWSKIPPFQHHLFFCRGPRCTARGADELWPYLQEKLAAHGLRREPERVLCVQTGCLYPCNLGPVLIVYPAGVWYGHLTPELIDQLVAQHLVDGEPVTTQIIHQ